MFGDAGITSVAYSPDGSKIVSSGKGGTLKVWGERFQNRTSPFLMLTSAFWLVDAASLTLESEKTNAHSDWIKSVAFSPDGKTIVSGSDDKTLKVWNSGER